MTYEIDAWHYVELSKELIRQLGPTNENPETAAEGWDRALDAEAEAPTDYMARVIDDTPRLMAEDRQVFDTVQRLINLRTARGKAQPDWLGAISEEIVAGKLRRPPAKRGRPAGAGGARDPGAQLAIAMNVNVVKRALERDGHRIPAYANEGDRSNTVAAIVSEALKAEGMDVGIDTVIRAYRAWGARLADKGAAG